MGDIGQPRRQFEVLPEWPARPEPHEAPAPGRAPVQPRVPDQPHQAPSEPAR